MKEGPEGGLLLHGLNLCCHLSHLLLRITIRVHLEWCRPSSAQELPALRTSCCGVSFSRFSIRPGDLVLENLVLQLVKGDLER
jgi:hypothetical protein